MDHKQYVPILKAKSAELWGLSGLKPNSQRRITPLFELPPIRKVKGVPVKPLKQHVADVVKAIESKWGTSQCFFDLRWLTPLHGDAAYQLAFDAARAKGILAIPVILPDSPASTLAAVKKVVDVDHRGAMLRCKVADLSPPDTAKAAIAALGLGVNEVDFLLDYRTHEMTLKADLPSVVKIAPLKKWRSLIAASGLFPDSVADCNDGSWHHLRRKCWTSWVAPQGTLDRIPSFSDYAVRSTGAPAAGGNPPVTLRYTTDKSWLVRVEGSLQGGQAKNMHKLCDELVARSEFAGSGFSMGDEQIEKTATKANPTPGGATQWLQWAMNHHLEQVSAQVASQP